jgi:sterol desaturase/sphingolipid hydroxylase (fatty acid hydroxylase superfamily)
MTYACPKCDAPGDTIRVQEVPAHDIGMAYAFCPSCGHQGPRHHNHDTAEAARWAARLWDSSARHRLHHQF